MEQSETEDTHPAAMVTAVESGTWEGAHMKDVTTSPSIVERSLQSERPGPLSPGLSNLTARLFAVGAERWRRRAQFYERHRDYFPRLASGPFVDRCRELELAYRGIAQKLFAMPARVELVPVRITVSRLKSSRPM